MKIKEFNSLYWRYYLTLESDFIKIEKYLEFDLGENYLYNGKKTTNIGNSLSYSVEFVKQYQAICSEIDVVFKVICKELGKRPKSSIDEYAKIILANEFWKNVCEQKIEFLDNIQLQPFYNWKETMSPCWWKSYNKVKHARMHNFSQANLKNVLNALAGLFMLENYLIKYLATNNDIANEEKGDTIDGKIIDVPENPSRLFKMNNWDVNIYRMGDMLIKYN